MLRRRVISKVTNKGIHPPAIDREQNKICVDGVSVQLLPCGVACIIARRSDQVERAVKNRVKVISKFGRQAWDRGFDPLPQGLVLHADVARLGFLLKLRPFTSVGDGPSITVHQEQNGLFRRAPSHHGCGQKKAGAVATEGLLKIPDDDRVYGRNLCPQTRQVSIWIMGDLLGAIQYFVAVLRDAIEWPRDGLTANAGSTSSRNDYSFKIKLMKDL